MPEKKESGCGMWVLIIGALVVWFFREEMLILIGEVMSLWSFYQKVRGFI